MSVVAARRTGIAPLIGALLGLTEGRGQLLRHHERDWASITFSGTRHQVELEFAGDEAVTIGEALIAALPGHEFLLAGELVVDAAIVSVERVMWSTPRLRPKIELLTVKDA